MVIGDEPAGLDYLRQESGLANLRQVPSGSIRKVATRSINPFRYRPAAGDIPVDVILVGAPEGLEARAVKWIPDFQEERLPQFFSAAELNARRRRNKEWLRRHRHIMVSSEDVRGDLGRHYPGYDGRVHVLNFASFPEVRPAPSDIAALRVKYVLPERYFICNNQIWKHKDHATILRALREIPSGEIPAIVFTGKEHDYRDRGYAASVRSLAAELSVANRVHFLGFLPRADQLGLTAGAIAVVQPSLCEGWSAVVEDAKALGKYVIASDIAVHREQLNRNADFFPPEDHSRLAELLSTYRSTNPLAEPLDYADEQRRFAERLLALIKETAADFERSGVPCVFASPA
jgi:glycosyltransferase involved in cell wall biosynthesis